MFNIVPAFWQRRGTAPPAGDVTIYEGAGTTGEGVVDGPALDEQTAFLARLTGYSKLTFDELVSPFVGVYNSGDPILGVGFVKNTITATFSCVTPAGTEQISSDTLNGRYNTTPASEISPVLDPLYADGLKISITAPITISFSPAVAAFGFFATDIGDFAGVVGLRLTKSDTTTITYPLTFVTSLNGNLYFWGIVDTTGTTYTKLEFIDSSGTTEDFFGLDDLVYVPASYIIP
jgi:hypothetical protein